MLSSCQVWHSLPMLHMYVAFQDSGVLFDITRTDGYPFQGLSLEVNYHNPPLDHLLPL